MELSAGALVVAELATLESTQRSFDIYKYNYKYNYKYKYKYKYNYKYKLATLGSTQRSFDISHIGAYHNRDEKEDIILLRSLHFGQFSLCIVFRLM